MDYWQALQANATWLKRRIRREAAITECIGPVAEINILDTGKRGNYLVVWQPLVRQPWYVNFN